MQSLVLSKRNPLCYVHPTEKVSRFKSMFRILYQVTNQHKSESWKEQWLKRSCTTKFNW